ncbi:MAG: M20/M25/M40 family metallo-hydrolase [Victivallaceae bacterium]|nr:M20/M25/M40 family metallo-hydrolase [Victivallaceae bacterium]
MKKANLMARYAGKAKAQSIMLIRELCAIPAPSNHEEKRAEFCRRWFEANGFEKVEIDSACNVLAPLNVTQDNPVSVIMAHTDTVFPDTKPMPFVEKDDWIFSPGVADDTANLAVMMSCAKIFREHFKSAGDGVLFVANSGEEGLGNLKGSRAIVEQFGSRIKELIALDSSNMQKLVTDAVGSHRYKVEIHTEGGHSFNDFGNRNAIDCMAAMIQMLYSVKVPVEENSRTTYNVGMISGGTSVNAIAEDAQMLYEYRSNNRICLAKMREIFQRTVAAFRATGIEVNVHLVGERPCAGEVDAKKIQELRDRVKASVKTILGKEMIESAASTDCNIPLSVGIPAVCFGVSTGRGGHTYHEGLDTSSLLNGCKLLLDFLNRSYL